MRPTHDAPKRRARGVTLIELVVAIAIAAVIGVMLGTYLTVPVRSSADVARRADLTDSADTAVRRLQRDLMRALPNSVRLLQAGTTWYLEFLDVRTGGRYRAEPSGLATDANSCPDSNADGLADEDALTFGGSVNDTCFRTLGTVQDLLSIDTTRDFVVVYNVGNGSPSADAYQTGASSGGNKWRVTAVATAASSENRLTVQSTPIVPLSYPLASPANRFHVISGPITFECNPVSGQLVRHSGYSIRTTQSTDFTGATHVVLTSGVSACTFTYDPGATERSGLVAVSLTLSSGGESVTLYHETHVDNVP